MADNDRLRVARAITPCYPSNLCWAAVGYGWPERLLHVICLSYGGQRSAVEQRLESLLYNSRTRRNDNDLRACKCCSSLNTCIYCRRMLYKKGTYNLYIKNITFLFVFKKNILHNKNCKVLLLINNDILCALTPKLD